MKHRHATITAICFAALVMAFAPFAPAEANSKGSDTTHMTFKHPVRIPGVTLPAGRYVFQLNDSRDWVRIFSEDNSKVFGPYLIMPRRRIGSTTKRAVIFDRSPEAGGVPRIRAWFGQGHPSADADWNGGYEFIYLNDRS